MRMYLITISNLNLIYLMALRQRSNKSKAWMQDYKQLIIDMKAELEKIVQENSSLKNSLRQAKIKQGEFQATIHRLQQQSKSSRHNNQIRQEQILSQAQKLKKQIKQQRSLLDQTIIQNKDLKAKVSTLSNLNKQIQSELNIKKMELNQKNINLAQLESQLLQIKAKISQQELQQQSKISIFKDINEFLKRIFERIEKDYSNLLKNSQDRIIESTPFRKLINKHKVQQSTSYKSNYKTPPLKISNKQQKTYNLHANLKIIKKEIAQQYYKIQQISESVLHKKVDNTLTAIENILSEISDRVQVSQSQITVV